MIFYITHHDFDHTIWKLKRHSRGKELSFIRPLSYRSLFNRLKAPVGHYIFTDFDRLSSYEVQVADTIARRVQETAPEARILNRPARVLERYELLRKLAAEGLNDFSVYRLDGDELPRRYPVFIRCEDDCHKPDTGLLHSQAELREAIERLKADGLSMKRRIAVEFCAAPQEDGYFRKFGVIKIGGHLVPQHVHHNDDWYVKRAVRIDGNDQRFREEVMTFLRDIPHASEIERAFAIANIDFGRIDYAIVDGRMQTYEINTNPTLPGVMPERARPGAHERRALFRERMIAAWTAIDTPVRHEGGFVKFELPRPRTHKMDALPLRSHLRTFYNQALRAIGY